MRTTGSAGSARVQSALPYARPLSVFRAERVRVCWEVCKRDACGYGAEA